MSQSSDIEAFINSTSANINQFITDQGSQNSYTAKLFDTTLSAQEKMEIMNSNMLQKQYELSGYRKGRLFLTDADSGEIEDPITGIRTKVRLSDFNMYDAVDNPSTLEDEDKKSSLSAQLQARQVADLTGKNVWELLPEDYRNVKNYQYQQVLGQFQDKDYKFTPYERDTRYQEMHSVPLNVFYRPTGKIDKYERVLVEAVNPTSNRQVTFDIGNNPYLNSRFSTVRSINSDANIRKLEAYQMNEDARKASISALQEIWDVDSDTLLGRVEDDIDLIQSSAYRSAARVLQYGPDFLVDSKKWKDIANAETGQVLADAWAGVSTATRRKFASKMIEASDAWDRGDYVDAILGWGSQLDRVLAESATQMALVAGGTLATGGLLGGTALAGTTAARLGSMFIGASVGATDVTLSMTEDYKLNNGGKNPSLSEVASMWAINTALLMPEALMAGINIGKVLPKSVSNRLNIAYQMKALPSRAKIVGLSLLEETIQEAFQESFETYGSQKGGMFNGEREFWSDILRNEGVKAGIVGGMAGGALSGVVQTTTAPFAYRKEVKITEARKKAQKDFEETTNIGTKADATISKSTINSIQALPPTIDSINQIDKALEIPNLSQQAQQILFKRKNDIIFELASKGQLDEATKRSYGSDPNAAIFKERVLLTDPEGELDFNGTRTPESIKQQYDKLKQEGKQLGLSDEVITKTLEEVKYDVRDGFRGYNTYIKSIRDLQEQIDEGISNNTDVDALVKQRTHTTNRLKHLYQNQVAKLGSLVNAAVDISQGRSRTVSVSFINSYNTKRPFEVRGYNLFIDRINSGTGVYGVIDNVKLEIAEMNEAMAELGITSTSDISKIDTLSKTFAKAVSDIKQKYDYNYFANPEEASTELSDKALSTIKKAVEAPSDKKLMEVRKEFSTNQLEQAIDKFGKDSKEAAVLQNIIKDRVETQKVLTENETEVSNIKKTATDNKSKFSEERLNKITDVNKLRRFYKAILTSTLTELRRVYGRNSSDTELKDLVDYYNTFADKVIEKGNTLKLASITQQAEETKEETKEVSPAEEATATEEVPSTESIDSASEPIDSTPSSSASKTVARKVFSTFDTFIKKLPKLRSLLSTSNFDKETELTELLNQHESAIEEYNRLMTVERKTWEDQLLTQKAKSFKNKNYLEERIDHYRDTVLDFNRRIRAAQRRLKKLTENGFTDEANTVQIQQLEQTINNLKTNKAYKNAIKQIKSLNTRMDKYFLTEKEIADRIKELDKFYGKNILPLERKIQDIITKSDNSVTKELLSSTFEILEDGRNILQNSINFNDEVTVSNFAESVLGNDLVDIKNPTIKTIVEKFQSFAPKFGTRKGLAKYLNRISRNDKGIETSYLFNAPHTQLLYQLDGKTLTVNPNVAVAVHLGLHQYLTHIDIYREFQPTDMEELGKIFGNMNTEPSSRLGEEDAFITSAFISAFGIPRSTIVNALGDTILRNLGITAKDSGTVGFYEKLSAAFGEQALVYAEQLGYITNTQIPSKTEAKYVLPDGTSATKNEDGLYPSDAVINPLNNRTNMIKFNFDLVEVVTEVATEVEALTLDNIYSKKPQPLPSKLPENMTARNTKDISPVAKLLQEKIFSKLFNTRYKINYELVDLVLQNRAAVENYLGLVPKDAIEKNHIKDVKEGLIGVSRTITQQLDDLAEVYNWGSPYLFFKWYMSKNGRFFMDSIHVNMQQFKELQRFFVLPENSHKIFELGYDKNGNVVESQQMKEFYYAIAQAFDSLGKHEDVEVFAKKMLAVPAEELKQALFPTNGKSQTLFGKDSKYGIKKLENFGQALLTIQAIKEYQNAVEKKQPRFKTWVSVENDSTTSAFFIGMLQHPYKDLIDSLGPKVGVVDSNNSSIPFSSDLTISHMKKMEVTSTKDGKTVKEKFLDIYQTIASKLKLIPVGKKGQKGTLHSNLWKAYFASKEGKYVAPEYKSLISYGIENVKTLYSSLLPALPEAALDGAVSSALRTLIKSPTMTYLYGQGKASLMKELGQELTTSLLTQFCDAVVVDESTLTEEEKAQRNAVLAVFDSLAKRIYDGKQLGVDRETLRNMLIKQYSTQIRLRLENRNGLSSMDSLEGERVYPTLHEYLSNTLAATYGSSVMEALDKSFGSMLEVNQSKNIMFNTMFDCFEQELNYELEKKRTERETAGERFTRADEQDVIKSLFDIMPAIKTLYDSATEQSVLLMDTEKMTDSRYAVNAPFFKGHNKDTGYIDNDARYSYANVRRFINSGRAGAVLPIHFLDGTAMAMMLDKYGKEILPLHDAIQVNAIGSTKATQYFNKINYLINKDYDLYSTLIDRFREVLDNTQKRREARGVNSDINSDTIGNTTDPIWKQFFGISEELIDDFGNVTKTKRPPTIQEFYNHVLRLQATNTNNRNDFYHGLGNNQRIIANIDGPVGSGWIVTDESIKSNAFMQGIIDEQNAEDIKRAFGSDPSTFTTKELLNELNYGALTDADVRVRILHELNKMDGNRESKEHMAYLEDLVKKIDLKALADSILNDNLKVQVYRSDTDSNKGRLENDIIKVALDGSTRSIPLTGQSGPTIYTHELIHAAFEYIINNSQTLGVNREIQELLNLQKQAMDAVTWEAFVPVDYETSPHKEFYIKKAKEVWDYIFNNSSDAKFSSLHEFLSYAMTNPVLREKLSDVYVDNKKNNLDKLRLLDRVIALGSALLDVFRGRGQIKDVARATANLFGSNIDIDSKVKLLDRLDTLMENIAHANNRSIKKLESHPIRAIESVFNTFADLISRGNKALAPKAAYIANIADETGYSKKWNVRLDDSFLDGVKAVSNVLGLLLVSRSRRQSLMPMLNSLVGLNQQGAIATIWREFQEPDEMTSDLELLSGFTKMTEQASKALEEQVRYDLKEAFGKDLKEHETYSLTQALLYTDLSSLLTFKDEQITNIDYVMDLLKNPEHINKEIEKIHNILYSQIKHDGQFNWYINSAKSLANQMVTNVGHEGTVLNARAIAEGSMTGKSYETTDAIVDLIDRLTTLYALSETNVSDLNVVSKLNTKGIENMLRTQYTFKKETSESQVIDKIHTMKGYTKLVMDEAIDIRYGRIEDKTDFESLGYTFVKKLPENSYTEQVGMAIYKRNNLSPKRRDGATFIITGQQAQGTSLMDSTFMMMDELKITSKEKIYSLHDEYLKKAEALSRSITSNMHSRIMSMDEIKNLGKGYTPILSPNGGASDFRINMSRTNQRSILKIEENAIDILSKMYAQKNMKVEASEKNKIVVNFLKNDMEKNKTEFSTFSPDGKNFVRLQKDSDNKFIREAWQFIPKELKDEIKKADKKDGFWVRDEWLIQLFGAPTISINDAKVVKNYTTNNMKYFIGISEVVTKLVAYLAKQNIVIRFPAVMIGNIISNFNMSYSLGFSPARVFKKTVENAKNVREYMDNKKALERIKYKQRIGTVTEAELKRVNWYQTKLESNPVHPLMEKGFYQSIVEDISMDDIESIGKISKPLSRKLKKHPRVKKVLQTLFLLEGNPYFDFMFQATQYSDFIARATHYQLMVERATALKTRTGKPNPYYIQQYKLDKNGKDAIDSKGRKIVTPEFAKFEKQLTIDIWNMFINYDKPQSSIEQYANDIGLIMFTKFLKRIQFIIAKGFIQSPVSSLLFLLSQSVICESSNIYDYVLPTRNIMWNVFNPLSDNLVNATIPIPIQYMTDTGLFGRN